VAPEPEIKHGWLSSELQTEFPKLALRYADLELRARSSRAAIKGRLRTLSDRFTGAKAINLRQEPIPWAYRVFFRQVGIDPDDQRTPPEAIALERMRAGAFRSQGLVDDALLIAMVETWVALVAFDAERLDGPIGLRLAARDEQLGGKQERPLSTGQIVIADAERPVSILFGDVAGGCAAHSGTRKLVLAAIQVKGVPELSVEEAIWTASEVLVGD